MITHEEMIDQIDTCNLTMEQITKASAYFEKIGSPVHRSYFSVRARFFDLLAVLARYQAEVERIAELTEGDIE